MADLNEILQRSRVIMNNTKDLPYGGYVEKAGGIPASEYGDVVFESKENTSSTPSFSEKAASKSKLPQEIIEAMRKSSSEPVSIIDTVGISESLKNPKLTQQKASLLSENKQQKLPQPSPTQSQIVDYSLIRMMIEETMKKYMGQLKKSLLNENKGSGLQMMTQKGNTFRFVTEDGKIFEGKLTYKGNIKD